MNIYLLSALIFTIDLSVAFAWARCVKAVSDNKAMMSALWSGFITLCGTVTIISYTQNNILLIPAVIGSSIGTYLSVSRNKTLKDDNQE